MLVPGWAGVAWTAAFFPGLGLHVWHMITAPGRVRVWHAAHVLMAAGMIDMCWSGHQRFGAGGVVFAVAVAGVLALIVVALSRHGRVAGRWLITAVDLAAMVYMFAAMSHPVDAVTTALVLWFGVEALGWAFGLLKTAPSSPVESQGPASIAIQCSRPRTARSEAAVRASLVLMSLGMAYLLLATLSGAAAMSM